jgi:hypothetical protein
MQQRRQEVVDPAEAWRDIGNAWQLRTRQLAEAGGHIARHAPQMLFPHHKVHRQVALPRFAQVERGALYAHQPRRARQPRVVR